MLLKAEVDTPVPAAEVIDELIVVSQNELIVEGLCPPIKTAVA